MKRSEAISIISKNLQKHDNIFRGYAKESISLKCACDNLATYLLKEIEEMGMLPPAYIDRLITDDYGDFALFNEWEFEDDEY